MSRIPPRTKYSDSLIRDMEQLAIEGIPKRRICATVGIATKTYDRWERGEGGVYNLWECNCVKRHVNLDGETVRVYRSVSDSTKDTDGEICKRCKVEYRLKPTFDERMRRARATCMRNLINIMQRAAPSDWRAADKLLEKLFAEFGKKSTVQLTGKNGMPIQTTNIDLNKDSGEEAVKKYIELLKNINSGGLVDNETEEEDF